MENICKFLLALGVLICLALALNWLVVPAAAQSDPLVFLSTQARPAAEAAEMRRTILANAPEHVDFEPVAPQELAKRVAAAEQGNPPKADVVGALHADLLALATQGDLAPIDDLAARLTNSGVPDPLLMLGRLGTSHQFYIPWMQAGYIMVANKKALRYLPAGADINTLTYDQFAAWGKAIAEKTGKRVIGFPAGEHGLIDRFFEGFLYPSFTGGVVVPFRAAAAEAMWKWFRALWTDVNPASVTYDSMQQPLLAGDVWIAFDHVARLLPALHAQPDQFLAFPTPSGPRGRGYMPVLAGLGVVKGASDMKKALGLIHYLRQPETQLAMARSIGFFPVVRDASLEELDPDLKTAAAAFDRMRTARDAVMVLLPIGLGEHGREFDGIFTRTFARIVLHNEDPKTVLDDEAAMLQHLMTQTGAHCWRPDPPSNGPCKVN